MKLRVIHGNRLNPLSNAVTMVAFDFLELVDSRLPRFLAAGSRLGVAPVL